MTSADVVVDGIPIGPSSDLVAMFRRQLKGDVVFPSKTAYGSEDGVARVLGATRGTAVEARVREAVVTLLTDQDSEVRAGAVMAIDSYPRGFDGEKLLKVLDKHVELFHGIPALASGFPDLEWEMLRAIAGTRSESRRIRDRLREAVTDAANGVWVLGDLSRIDPKWVAGHARDVTAGRPARAVVALTNLQEPQAREAFVQALRPESPDFRREVVEKLGRPIRDPKELARLSKLLSD